MIGKPQTILELLRAITGWTPEEVAEAFGDRRSENEKNNG